MGVEVSIDTRGLDALLAGWDDGVERVVEKVAYDVLADAQRRAPVRTGYLRNSGQVEPAEDRFSRYIHFRAGYAAYVEYGTRRMRPQPYLTPAVERHRRTLQEDFRALIARLAAKS